LPAGPGVITPPPPVAVGPVAVFAQGTALYGLALGDGHRRWAWRSGQEFSGMWAWRGLVVVLSSSLTNFRYRLTGLDAATGAVRWVLRLPGRGPYGWAATSDGGLAVASTNGVLQLVSLATGRLRWARPAATMGALGVAHGLVLLASDGRLRAYSDETGRTRWTVSGLPGQPALQVLDGLALVSSNAYGPGITTTLTAIRPSSGSVAWRFDSRTGVIGLAYGPAGFAVTTFVPAQRLYLLSTSTGRARWHVATAATTPSAPLVSDASIVVGESNGSTASRLVSRSAASGRPRWAHPLPDQNVVAMLQLGTDLVIVTNPESLPGPATRVVAYQLARGKAVWTVGMPEFVVVPPVPVANDLLVQSASLVNACPTGRAS
jgi:outer membrane protein assembly factor BamB